MATGVVDAKAFGMATHLKLNAPYAETGMDNPHLPKITCILDLHFSPLRC